MFKSLFCSFLFLHVLPFIGLQFALYWVSVCPLPGLSLPSTGSELTPFLGTYILNDSLITWFSPGRRQSELKLTVYSIYLSVADCVETFCAGFSICKNHIRYMKSVLECLIPGLCKWLTMCLAVGTQSKTGQNSSKLVPIRCKHDQAPLD